MLDTITVGFLIGLLIGNGINSKAAIMTDSGWECDETEERSELIMKNFIKGALALWTVLTTIWTFITFDIIRGMIEGFGERDNQIQKQDDQYCM